MKPFDLHVVSTEPVPAGPTARRGALAGSPRGRAEIWPKGPEDTPTAEGRQSNHSYCEVALHLKQPCVGAFGPQDYAGLRWAGIFILGGQ